MDITWYTPRPATSPVFQFLPENESDIDALLVSCGYSEGSTRHADGTWTVNYTMVVGEGSSTLTDGQWVLFRPSVATFHKMSGPNDMEVLNSVGMQSLQSQSALYATELSQE